MKLFSAFIAFLLLGLWVSPVYLDISLTLRNNQYLQSLTEKLSIKENAHNDPQDKQSSIKFKENNSANSKQGKFEVSNFYTTLKENKEKQVEKISDPEDYSPYEPDLQTSDVNFAADSDDRDQENPSEPFSSNYQHTFPEKSIVEQYQHHNYIKKFTDPQYLPPQQQTQNYHTKPQFKQKSSSYNPFKKPVYYASEKKHFNKISNFKNLDYVTLKQDDSPETLKSAPLKGPGYLPPYEKNLASSDAFKGPEYLPPHRQIIPTSENVKESDAASSTQFKVPDYPAPETSFKSPEYLPPTEENGIQPHFQREPPNQQLQDNFKDSDNLPNSLPPLDQLQFESLPDGYDFQKPPNSQRAIEELHKLPEDSPSLPSNVDGQEEPVSHNQLLPSGYDFKKPENAENTIALLHSQEASTNVQTAYRIQNTINSVDIVRQEDNIILSQQTIRSNTNDDLPPKEDKISFQEQSNAFKQNSATINSPSYSNLKLKQVGENYPSHSYPGIVRDSYFQSQNQSPTSATLQLMGAEYLPQVPVQERVNYSPISATLYQPNGPENGLRTAPSQPSNSGDYLSPVDISQSSISSNYLPPIVTSQQLNSFDNLPPSALSQPSKDPENSPASETLQSYKGPEYLPPSATLQQLKEPNYLQPIVTLPDNFEPSARLQPLKGPNYLPPVDISQPSTSPSYLHQSASSQPFKGSNYLPLSATLEPLKDLDYLPPSSAVPSFKGLEYLPPSATLHQVNEPNHVQPLLTLPDNYEPNVTSEPFKGSNYLPPSATLEPLKDLNYLPPSSILQPFKGSEYLPPSATLQQVTAPDHVQPVVTLPDNLEPRASSQPLKGPNYLPPVDMSQPPTNPSSLSPSATSQLFKGPKYLPPSATFEQLNATSQPFKGSEYLPPNPSLEQLPPSSSTLQQLKGPENFAPAAASKPFKVFNDLPPGVTSKPFNGSDYVPPTLTLEPSKNPDYLPSSTILQQIKGHDYVPSNGIFQPFQSPNNLPTTVVLQPFKGSDYLASNSSLELPKDSEQLPTSPTSQLLNGSNYFSSNFSPPSTKDPDSWLPSLPSQQTIVSSISQKPSTSPDNFKTSDNQLPTRRAATEELKPITTNSLSSHMTSDDFDDRLGSRKPFLEYGLPPAKTILSLIPNSLQKMPKLSQEARHTLQTFMPKDILKAPGLGKFTRLHSVTPVSTNIRTVQILLPNKVKTLKILETLDQTGIQTIRILGHSNEPPTGDHRVVKVVSDSHEQNVQTVKIFNDVENATTSADTRLNDSYSLYRAKRNLNNKKSNGPQRIVK